MKNIIYTGIRSFLRYTSTVMHNIRREHIGAFAAQSAFFLIMSFIPMVFLTLMIINISGVEEENLYVALENFLSDINVYVSPISYRKFSTDKTAIISVTTLLTAWSAGKAFKALTEGFHSVLHVSESRNYILQRLRGLVYSLIFSVVVACLFFVGVFGNAIHELIVKIYPPYSSFTFLISWFRKIFTLCFMIIIFVFIYRFVPDWSSYTRFGRRKLKMKYILPGAVISSSVICAYTMLFSFYVENYSGFLNLYGSLNTLICVMLWLYASVYILILGFRFSCYINRINIRRNSEK